MISRPADLLDPLLQRVLAARPATIDDLDDIAGALGWTGAAALETLQDLELAVADADGALRFLDPVQALTRRATRSLEAQKHALDETSALLAALPRLIETAAKTDAADGLIGEVVRNHDDVWRKWWEHSQVIAPRRPGVVTPDAVMLRAQVLDDIDRVAQDFVERGFHMRCILDIAECTDAEGGTPAWISTLIGGGVEIRAMADPPSWFYADAGVMGGIPLTWGQGNPAGMIVLRDSALLDLAASYFESLWIAAVPVGATAHGWGPVLRLLSLGRSDKQIADALGTSLRTVRRRIADAMDELGAPTRFELGVAWARRTGG